MWAFFQIAIGFLLLFAGSESLVRGSVSLAISSGISRLVVGLTIIAFATSSPELFVGVGASLEGKNGLVLGNVLGSNICNICLIIGTAALLRPIKIAAETIKREAPILLAATLITCGTLWNGQISRLEGIFLLILFVVYNTFLVIYARQEGHQGADYLADPIFEQRQKKITSALMIAAGLVLLITGAQVLILGSVTVARHFHISEAIIGLTLLAFGTSLPELAAAISASMKNESDLVVGNVIGSNLFNILCVLGVASIISPIATESIQRVDLAVFCGTGILLLPVMKSGYRVTRWEGCLLLLIYGAYLAYLVQT
jgi:cation:H+ antiporter